MNEAEQQLLQCFRDSTCASFSHEDHLHVAWLLLRQHSLTSAIEQFAGGARRLAAERGHPEYYHETVTWAYMILVNQRMQDSDSDWDAFRAENQDLFARHPSALRPYYRESTLESDLARRVFLLPDAGLRSVE